MKTLPEPTSLLMGITYKEVLSVMDHNDVLCSVDKFTRILSWCQQKTLEYIALADQAKREAALDRMVADAEELGLYDMEPASGKD